MGCTHYPFVIPLIQQIVGEKVRVIDPAPAIARQVQRVLEARQLVNEGTDKAKVEFYTSGDPAVMRRMITRLLGATAQSASSHLAKWGTRLNHID